MLRRLRIAALFASMALFFAGCPGGGVGDSCDQDPCQGDLICDPVTRTCVEPPAPTDSGPGTDALTPGTDALTPGTDALTPGTDALTPGTDAMSGTDAATSTDAGAFFTPCAGDLECSGVTSSCVVPLCPFGATVGFCLDPAVNVFCGGFGGIPCPMGSGLVCHGHGNCVADAGGICLTPAQHAEVCAAQPMNWSCP